MNNNGVYEHFRILNSNSEEVRELEGRWISGDVRYADEVRHKYSGFTEMVRQWHTSNLIGRAIPASKKHMTSI